MGPTSVQDVWQGGERHLLLMTAFSRVAFTLIINLHHAAAWNQLTAIPVVRGTSNFFWPTRKAATQMQVNKDGYLEKGPRQWIPPNMGGERVIRKKEKQVSKPPGKKRTIFRRTVISGGFGLATLYAASLQQQAAKKAA